MRPWGAEGQAQTSITVNAAPAGGFFSVSPTSGSALSTSFNLLAGGWTDTNSPLTYYFEYCLGGPHHSFWLFLYKLLKTEGKKRRPIPATSTLCHPPLVP